MNNKQRSTVQTLGRRVALYHRKSSSGSKKFTGWCWAAQPEVLCTIHTEGVDKVQLRSEIMQDTGTPLHFDLRMQAALT